MSRGSALQTSASSTPRTSRSGSRRVLKPVTEGAGLQFEPAVGDGHRYTAGGGTLRSADRLWPYRAAQNVRPHAASRTLFAAHYLVHVGAWFRHPLLGDGCYVGLAFAQTGWLYPLFGPLIGWRGVALTGSDTSSTVLFGGLQRVSAKQLHINPILMAAANSSGGVMGKMIDAQSIAFASTPTKWYGHEGTFCGSHSFTVLPSLYWLACWCARKRKFGLCRYSPHDEFARTRGGRYSQCCRSPLALAARFARKDGGGRAHRSMQQHQGFSLDSKAETTWAHLPLYRRGGRR